MPLRSRLFPRILSVDFRKLSHSFFRRLTVGGDAVGESVSSLLRSPELLAFLPFSFFFFGPANNKTHHQSI
uniref:Uncharacterized protein n=1 Tax=Octopus bimaculoides TaxID=37653 RepID=A0A0L8HSN0_OCTBM